MVVWEGVLLAMLFVIIVPVVGVGYLLGSLPFGLIFARLAGLGDVRQIGSGNIGATNVLRTGNRKIAAATLLADMLKGTIAVGAFLLLFPNLEDTRFLAILAGFAAVLGHMFPIWLCFKGGKGVATYLGVLLAMVPWIGLIFIFVWLSCAVISRYSSLSALIGVFVVGVVGLVLTDAVIAIPLALMSVTVIIKHHANIKRLIAGTESKITFSRK